MKSYMFILGVLGTWRVAHLLSAEDGPSRILVRLRKAIGGGFWGDLMECFYCLSLWIAVPFCIVLGEGVKERCLLWLALSGGASLLDRFTSRETAPPAIYFEDSEEEHGDERDALLREKQSTGRMESGR